MMAPGIFFPGDYVLLINSFINQLINQNKSNQIKSNGSKDDNQDAESAVFCDGSGTTEIARFHIMMIMMCNKT